MRPLLKWPLFACTTALLGACVTINIYFPAAAAEKAADRIIDEVWQLKNGTPAAQPKRDAGEAK